MIKFILGFIAVVLMALVAYTLTQSEKKAEHKVVKKVETKVTKKQKVEQPKVTQPKVKEHISVKNNTIDEVIALQKKVEMSDSIESADEIGEGLQNTVADLSSKIGKDLTLESIQNSNVSEDEKDHMLAVLAAYQSYRDRNNALAISEEEGLKVLTKEFN